LNAASRAEFLSPDLERPKIRLIRGIRRIRSRFVIDAARQQGAPRGVGRNVVTLAHQVPGGVGGIFMEQGVGYLWLVEPSKRTEAIAALADTPLGIGLQQGGFPLKNAVVLKARWNFAQLADWYAYVTSRALPGVQWTSADIQEARNRLEFGVISEAARLDLESRLKALDLPCNLVAVEIRAMATTR
jgi:hypothetical protein